MARIAEQKTSELLHSWIVRYILAGATAVWSFNLQVYLFMLFYNTTIQPRITRDATRLIPSDITLIATCPLIDYLFALNVKLSTGPKAA